jgi:hypothetical protein
MLDTPGFLPAATLLRALALIAMLGLGGSLPGCADIHPEGDDPDAGMLDSPTDEAVHERESLERMDEHDEEQEHK